jgi:hypothetical protein
MWKKIDDYAISKYLYLIRKVTKKPEENEFLNYNKKIEIGELLNLRLEYNNWYYGSIFYGSTKFFIHKNCFTLFSEKEIKKENTKKDFKELEEKYKVSEDITTLQKNVTNLWKADLAIIEIKDTFFQILDWKDFIKEEKYDLEQLFLIEKKMIDIVKNIKKDLKDTTVISYSKTLLNKLIEEGNELLQVDLNINALKAKKKIKIESSVIDLYRLYWEKNKKIEDSKAEFIKKSISQSKKLIKKRNLFQTQRTIQKKVTEFTNIPDGNLQLVLEVQSLSIKVFI